MHTGVRGETLESVEAQTLPAQRAKSTISGSIEAPFLSEAPNVAEMYPKRRNQRVSVEEKIQSYNTQLSFLQRLRHPMKNTSKIIATADADNDINILEVKIDPKLR